MAAWTPERRERQRQAIQRWKPWQKSTGPTSLEGKAATSRNAWTGGHWKQWRDVIKQINEALREQRNRLGGS